MATNKITKIKFHFGSNPGASGLEVDVTRKNLVILVGPGGSGKTKSLLDIMSFFNPAVPHENKSNIFIDNISADFPNTLEEVLKVLSKKENKSSDPQNTIQLVRSFGERARGSLDLSHTFSYEDIAQTIKQSGNTEASEPGNALFGTLGFISTGYISLQNRLSMMNMDDMQDRFYPQKLFSDPPILEKVSSYVLKRLKKHYLIKKWRRGFTPLPDKGEIGYLQRLSTIKVPRQLLEQEQMFTPTEISHYGVIPPAALGQGMVGYVGIVAALHTFHDMTNVLIDEPDSFLHPPFQKYLGEDLIDIAESENKLFIVTTHSPNFVLGALRKAKKVIILRMEYTESTKTGIVREMDSETLLKMANEPILRTSNTFSALFHQGAVVSESDSDRKLYDEIHWRNVRYELTKPSADTIFINGNSYSNVGNFLSPLRKMGVPTAAIFDFDTILYEGQDNTDRYPAWLLNLILKKFPVKPFFKDRLSRSNVENAWKKILGACGVQATAQSTLLTDILALSDTLSLNYLRKEIKEQGIEKLSTKDKVSAIALMNSLNKIGVFLVPVGELESWLGYIKKISRTRKNVWLNKMFIELGSDPESLDYKKPEDRDVWKFMKEVAEWISNPVEGMSYE